MTAADVPAQKRMRAIAMSLEERDDFLSQQRTCRVATVAADGSPHVAPMWFVWDGECVWLNSLVRSQRWTDLTANPRVALVVDAGEEYNVLRGVEIRGVAEVVGDVPRTAEMLEELVHPESLMGAKYSASGVFVSDGRHAWLRVRPKRLVSWDFRKNPSLVRD